ncbi:MAG: hypothetical protein HFJ51_05605 [Clostridia bacterium]|nr:hypothetical protein [Clostridia bacterium]
MEEKNKAPKAQAKHNTKSNKLKRERKPIFTAENLLKWKNGFFGRLVSIVIAALLLLTCFNFAFDYTVEAYGDGAYKYSDDAYKYIEDSMKNYLGGDGPDIRKLQDCFPAHIGKFTSDYENGQTTLIATLYDGFFVPTVTLVISQEFKIIGENGEIIEPPLQEDTQPPKASNAEEAQKEASEEITEVGTSTTDLESIFVSGKDVPRENTGFRRNFNSIQEYQNYFWSTAKTTIFKLTALWFAIIFLILIFLDLALTQLLSKSVEKKTVSTSPNVDASNVSPTSKATTEVIT